MKLKNTNVNGMAIEIRRCVESVAAFECCCCGKKVKRAAKFEYRHPQYVTGHVAELMSPVCRNCCYKLTFGTKGIMARKRSNIIEEQSDAYKELT